ncbi:MAG TPA: hypothetical protein VKU41_15800 [Polyangiaceae bacterium]|nr:hypothetical protein [Polyangiaceae bacterium]
MGPRAVGFLLLASCGAGGGAAGAGDSGGATEASAQDAPSADGATWIPTMHACSFTATGVVQSPPPPAGPPLTPCPGASLANAQITGTEGGPVAPGATATIAVLVTNAGAQIAYPCLALASDHADVTFGAGGPEQYALTSQVTFSTEVTFGPSLAPGTRVRFAAWISGWAGQAADGASLACTSGLLEWDVVL